MPDPTGRISHIHDMHRGFSWKPAVRVATTANITISTALNNGDSLDGVTLATGDRVLVKDQSTGSQNGIYIVGASPGRAADMDQDGTTSVPAEEVMGSIVYVIAGTANAGTLWRNTNTTTPILGTTALTFTAITLSGASALRWFILTDYGAIGDGTTSDDTAITNWIAAFNAAGGGVLYAPAPTVAYKTAGGHTITGSGIMLGDGGASYDNAVAGTRFNCTSQTAVLFTVSSKAFRFAKIAAVNTYAGTPSAGSAVLSDSAYLEQRVDFEDCTFQGFRDNVDVKVGAQWYMRGCFSIAPVRYGLRIRNTVNGDAGDWAIDGCNFSAQTYDSDSAIRIESSGGGKITNVKINMALDAKKFNHGIDLDVASTTVDLQVANVSVENIRGDSFHAVSAGADWWNILISNFQSQDMGGTPISIVGAVAGDFSYVTIMGCSFRKTAGVNAIVLTNVQHAIIGGVIHNLTNLTSETTCTDITILGSAAASFATPAIVLGSAAAAGAASTVIRSDSTIVAFDATVPVTQAFSDAAATGSAAFAARRDHRHGMPASPAATGIGEILISNTPSTPLIFADLIQNEAQTDLVYADP